MEQQDSSSSSPDSEQTLARQAEQVQSLTRLSNAFGRSLSNAFAGGIVQGRKFEDVLRGLGQKFVEFGLKAAFKPIETSISGLFNQVLQGSAGKLATGTGTGGAGLLGSLGALFGGTGVGAPLNISPVAFAEGGVISSPGLFPLGKGLGLAGEKGAEAILPLARGPDGRLGVANTGGGRASTVVVNISTPDIESFRRSEGQVATALARAVGRGQRGL